MSVSGNFLLFLLLLGTSLTAQEDKTTRNASASVTIVSLNEMNPEELIYAKAQLDEVKYIRLVDQKLNDKGYHYPALTRVTDENNLRKFSFTDILTSDDPMAIKAFVDNLKNENLKDLVDIKINPADHQCELTVAQNIDPELLKHIFSELGFDGYQIYAQN